ATALPTAEPTPAPTEAPTSAPTLAPTVQNQNVTVIDNNGQSQAQQQARATALPTADPPQPTSITFYNQEGNTVDLYWVKSAGNDVFYSRIPTGDSVDQQTYVGQVWQVKWDDPCCSMNVIQQVTATAAPQTVDLHR
ncbi:MAG: hypothetical protein ACREQ5_29630, partial [Candidatus Dormibacteria bacterium]